MCFYMLYILPEASCKSTQLSMRGCACVCVGVCVAGGGREGGVGVCLKPVNTLKFHRHRACSSGRAAAGSGVQSFRH